MRSQVVGGLAVVAFCFCTHAFGYTWYVDGINGNDTGNDGYTWAAPFATITNAMQKLADTNAVEGFNGGHAVFVTNANANSYQRPHDFQQEHSGAENAPNLISAAGDAVHLRGGAGGIGSYDSLSVGLGSSRTTNLTFEGFVFTYGYENIVLGTCSNIVFRNCTLQRAGLHYGHVTVGTSAGVTFTNCVLGFVSYPAFDVNNCDLLDIRNCVIFNTMSYGIDANGTTRAKGVALKSLLLLIGSDAPRSVCSLIAHASHVRLASRPHQ